MRVRYAETDQMGVAYYGNYFTWMEVGRAEYCRSVGFRYRDMEEEDGILLVVAEATCRYRAPARYDDEVIVHTSIESSNSRLVRFGYEMTESSTGRKLATGTTTHIFCNRELKPVKLNDKYWGIFAVSGRSEDSQQ